MNGELAAAILGLLGGLSWGTGDFLGGFASRRISVYSVVFFGQITGASLLLVITLLRGEAIPPAADLLTGAAAGAFGCLGLLSFYRAMTVTKMSVAAPTTAVLTALIPVGVSFVTEGAPELTQFAGIVLAMAAIFLLSREDNAPIQLRDLRLPMLAGFGFGMYLTLLDRASETSVFWPNLAGRAASITIIGIVGWRLAKLPRPAWPNYRIIAASGIFDTAGNTLYALATQLGRLDVAAVLSSLYPAATVGLAFLVLKERLHRVQWIGVGVALAAIILIAA